MAPWQWTRPAILLITAVLLVAGCDSSSDPQSSTTTSSVSGTVVFDQSGAPAPGIDVTFERCAGGSMMTGDDWDHAQHMTTGHDGQFHFEYHHEAMHRFRGREAGCDLAEAFVRQASPGSGAFPA